MKDLYLLIAARLIEQIPELRRVDIWKKQPHYPGKDKPAFPAVFIQFSEVEWKTSGRRVQEGSLQVVIWLHYNTLADSEFANPGMEAGLAWLDLHQKIFVALQGFSGPNFASLDRITTDFDDAPDNIGLDAIAFSTSIRVQATVRNKVRLEADLKVLGEIDQTEAIADGL